MDNELCKCPLLQMAAESERMAGAGIIPCDNDSALNGRLNAIMVGQLRRERKCPGPNTKFGHVCRYYYETHGYTLVTDPNVPLLKRHVEDGQDDKYI